MSEHFIKNIEIKNFKCFEDFKTEGFGRVNLIGGKNNVGKTAFMEGCFLSQSKDTEDLFRKLLEIKTHRDIINNLLLKTTREKDLQALIKDNVGIKLGIPKEHYKIRERESPDGIYKEDYEWKDGVVSLSLDKQYLKIYTKDTEESLDVNEKGEGYLSSNCDKYTISDLIDLLDISFSSTKKRFSLNFISPYSNSNEELENLIGESKLDDKYENINQYLLEVFNVSSIDIIKNKPMLKSNGKYRELSHFGQGIKTFINIISSILLLEDDILFIDEIENGIHYSILDELWKIILTISKQQNVQVFATTHSKECIESYARVVEELNDKNITFIKLGKNRKDEIKAMIYPYEWFVDSIEQEEEVRGW